MRRFLFFFLFFAALFLAGESLAQTVTVDMGDESGTATGRIVQMLLLISVISVAPYLLVMLTSFTRLAVVFSITRQALSTQQTPPNMVLVSLALFLTAFIMAPAFEASWKEGMQPLMEEKIEWKEGVERSLRPFRDFMLKNVREKDLELFLGMVKETRIESPEQVPITALIPAFMISELRRAFEIGFLIFVPFLIIDMVIASVLMSMGMMMLPPTMLALPFKLIFFVMVDGWYLLVGSLVNSFVT